MITRRFRRQFLFLPIQFAQKLPSGVTLRYVRFRHPFGGAWPCSATPVAYKLLCCRWPSLLQSICRASFRLPTPCPQAPRTAAGLREKRYKFQKQSFSRFTHGAWFVRYKSRVSITREQFHSNSTHCKSCSQPHHLLSVVRPPAILQQFPYFSLSKKKERASLTRSHARERRRRHVTMCENLFACPFLSHTPPLSTAHLFLLQSRREVWLAYHQEHTLRPAAAVKCEQKGPCFSSLSLASFSLPIHVKSSNSGP